MNYENQQQFVHEDVNEIEFICDDGKPIQIVRFDKNTGKFTLDTEAVNVDFGSPGIIGSQREHRILLFGREI